MSDDTETEDEEMERADRIRSGRQGRRSGRSRPAGSSDTPGGSGTPGTTETNGTTVAPRADGTSGSTGTSEPEESAQDDETGPWDAPLKDLDNVSFYLTEAMHNDLDIAQDLANAAYRREYGEELEKNREFRPLLLDVAMEIVEDMDAEELHDRFESSDRLPDPPEGD